MLSDETLGIVFMFFLIKVHFLPESAVIEPMGSNCIHEYYLSRYLIRLQRVHLKRRDFEENLFHPISFLYLFTNFPIPWYSSNRVTFTLLVSMGRRCSVSNHFWNGLSLVDKTASDLLSPNERNPPYIHTCDGLVQVGHLHHGLVG